MKKKDREVTTEMEMRKEEREVMMKEREEQKKREERSPSILPAEHGAQSQMQGSIPRP